MSGHDSKYFSTTKKGEIPELKEELNSQYKVLLSSSWFIHSFTDLWSAISHDCHLSPQWFVLDFSNWFPVDLHDPGFDLIGTFSLLFSRIWFLVYYISIRVMYAMDNVFNAWFEDIYVYKWKQLIWLA